MSIPDLNSILSNGWFTDHGEVTDSTSVASHGWVDPELGEEDYSSYPFVPFDRFNKEGTDYNPESELYDLLVTEAFNMHGIPMVYYVTTYNLNYDKVIGEDANRYIQRNFNIQVYYELPNEQEIWTRFGLEGLDNFHMFVSVRHFSGMSKFNQYGEPNAYEVYTPQEGDIVKSRYNNYYYEILTVKRQTNQVHRRVHIYDLIVKPLKDQHFSVSGAISFDPVNHEQDLADIFNVSAHIEPEKPRDLFDPPATEDRPDPFLNW